MHRFDYARPRSLGEASELLLSHGDGAALLAGGTDLIVQMAKGSRSPEVVIDLKGVEELSSQIEVNADHLRIGALARLADVETHAAVTGSFPALADAARVVGSVQIRNRATLGGNICNASPAADTAPPLLIYGAEVNVFGPRGGRTIPIARFFAGPGSTSMDPGEIVESIDLPHPGRDAGSSFMRLSRRRGMDLASVSVACLLRASGELRLAFGAAGPVPILVTDESKALLDEGASDEQDAILERLAGQARPISDIRAGEEYRRAMVRVLSRRALELARQRLNRNG